MTKTKSFTAVLLLLSLLTVSCASDTPEKADNADIVSDIGTDATAAFNDGLPAKDYNGEAFNILCRKEWAYEFDVSENGDIVNDAVLQRNLEVESRFNINFHYTEIEGGWDSREIFLNTLRGSIYADDNAFDMVAGYQAYIVVPALEGMFVNILDMKYLNPRADWWSQKCCDSTIIDNRLYMITGDIALTLWDSIYVMLFNKKIAADYDIGDVYSCVKEGKWTIDRLYEWSSMVSADLDGDGKYTEKDMYGFASSNDNHARVWFVPCQLPMTTRGNDGFMYMSYNTERTQEALIKLAELYNARSSYKDFAEFDETYIDWKDSNMFTDNCVLFAPGYLQTTGRLRIMETDFGIIPLPKFDESQDNYYTTVHDSTSMICFPRTVRDMEKCAVITEALCISSNKNVVPKYYDYVLKYKNSRDEESQEMIDLIRDSVIFDFGAIHTVPMDGIITLLGNLIIQNKTDFSAAYEQVRNKYETNLAEINKAYGKIE